MDLPCIRNPARDLANGYIVAEILCKSYPADICMASFDSGMGVSARLDNWAQIREIINRKGFIKLEQELVDDIVYYRGDACIVFMMGLYSSLTHKTVPAPRPPSSPPNHTADVPGYARATAAFKLKDSELNRSVDDLERKVKAAGAVLRHELSNKALRSKLATETDSVNNLLSGQREFAPISPLMDAPHTEVRVISVRAYGNEDNSPTNISPLATRPNEKLVSGEIGSSDFEDALGSICGGMIDGSNHEATILDCLRDIRDLGKLEYVIKTMKRKRNSDISWELSSEQFKARMKIVYDNI